MTKALTVYFFDAAVGSLTQTAGKLSFTYHDSWLAHPDSQALSCSLPLQADAFNDAQSRPFFAGLLPEGELRKLLARQFQVSDANSFGLLNEIGGECAGAVTFLEPGQTPPDAKEPQIHWLDESELVKILNDLPRRPMLAGDDGLRLSLAGAQDKLPVVVDDTRIGLAMNGTPSTHILKSSISSLQHSVANEHFCLSLAAAMKLPAARSSIRHAGPHEFLLVERYDRTIETEHHPRRLHQEDFCQALGIASETKYQHEGGPDTTHCCQLIRSVIRPSAPSLLKFVDTVIFNVLIGNHDAHGKNFSLLYKNGAPSLAPAYDILSTAVYPELSAKMAMKIGSQYEFKQMMPRHWEQFAKTNGLSVSQLNKRIHTLASRLPEAAYKLHITMRDEGNQTGSDLPENPLLAQIVDLIEQRCETSLRRFARNAL